jgi:hypothetical protein
MGCYRNNHRGGLNSTFLALLGAFFLIIALSLESTGAQESPNPKSVTTAAGEKSGPNAETPLPLSSLLTQTVVFIYEDKTPANSPNPIPGQVLGTAFIIGIPVPGHPEKSFPFIATAKHVVAGQSKILVRFTLKSGSEPGFAQYDLQELRSNNDLWESNDEGVDLIVFRTLVYDVVKFLMFPIELITSKETFTKENINVSDRVVIPCLMDKYPGVSQNYPIFRDGTIALITEEPISFTWVLGTRPIKTSQTLVFINSILNEGFSGAPVLFLPGVRSTPQGIQFGGKPWLIGIVHGFFPQRRTVIDAEGNNVIIVKREPGVFGQINPPKQLLVFSQENSGTGIVFPAWQLLDILQSDVVKKRVRKLADDEIAKEKKN